MAAIAQDLIARKVTSASHLAVHGGSNGGLMAGNMLVQYPQLFDAVVIESPLLDMRRYSQLLAGASWMEEYGNPDTADWAFIRTFSPYHLFDPGTSYPPTMIATSTRDDRVHPGHARKMGAIRATPCVDTGACSRITGDERTAARAQNADMRQETMRV